jgi:hypothetical protein
MAVCVGLPLTTNAPLIAAAAFAAASPKNVGVLIDALAIAHRKYARRRSALCDDHHKAGARYRKQSQGLIPSHLGEPDRRQSSRNRTDDCDTSLSEVECEARCNRSDYRDQRKWQSRSNAIADQDAACHQRGQRQRREIDPR